MPQSDCAHNNLCWEMWIVYCADCDKDIGYACYSCGGSGKVDFQFYRKPCPDCEGRGWLPFDDAKTEDSEQ